DWEERTFAIDGGLLKPNDVVVEIRSTTAPLGDGDPRRVGVLLDRVTYRSGPAPVTPYPAQLLYGALAAGMSYILLMSDGKTRRQGDTRDERRETRDERRETRDERRETRDERRETLAPGLLVWSAAMLAVSVGFLTLYRGQPPYPYPLRGLLPTIDAVLAA